MATIRLDMARNREIRLITYTYCIVFEVWGGGSVSFFAENAEGWGEIGLIL
jgi:hypothetical protein